MNNEICVACGEDNNRAGIGEEVCSDCASEFMQNHLDYLSDFNNDREYYSGEPDWYLG